MRVLVLADIDEFRWRHGTGQADVILSLGDVSDGLILEAAAVFGGLPVFAVTSRARQWKPNTPRFAERAEKLRGTKFRLASP
jgi:hypothetical protein